MKSEIEQIFILELKEILPNSSGETRKEWAKKIVDNDIQISVLTNYFMSTNNEVLSRFLWMLSDIGSYAPSKLLKVLPQLLEELHNINISNVESTFANYWMLAGVPVENEGEVIDLLMNWIQSSQMNITTKTRSIFVVQKLIEKYPELSHEFKICIQEQASKYSLSFKNRVDKVLASIS